MFESLDRLLENNDRFLEKNSIEETAAVFSFSSIFKKTLVLVKEIESLCFNEAPKIMLMSDSAAEIIASLLACYATGATLVPISVSYPIQEVEYIFQDSESVLLLCDLSSQERLRDLLKKWNYASVVIEQLKDLEVADISAYDAYVRYKKLLLEVDFLGERQEIFEQQNLKEVMLLMLYTSGTTSKPKGVLISRAAFKSQVTILHKEWQWNSEDRILCVLPLHHVHGLINILSCSFFAGATLIRHKNFEVEQVWQSIKKDRLTLFMAVPTIYHRMLYFMEEGMEQIEERDVIIKAAQKMRLFVSGSAALAKNTWKDFKELTGHAILERYGMTEIGMALSNPYVGERIAGSVGFPLKGVFVRIVDETGEVLQDGEIGEIQIQSPSLFSAYHKRTFAFEQSFTADRWFKTGDIAEVADGRYKILGRQSIDIIKSGGYKISALEIESVLLEHHEVAECAVLGVEDIDLGQKIVAVLVLKNIFLKDVDVSKESIKESLKGKLHEFCKNKLAAYKIPREYYFVKSLPRNALGKLQKKKIELFT